MEIQGTNRNFGKDLNELKQALMSNPRLQDAYKDPIPDWKTWIDLTDEDLKDLTEYLLHQLVFNEVLTSITKIIPLIEDHDFKVGVTLYSDEQCVYTTHEIRNDNTPLYISTKDLVDILNEELEQEENYCVREVYYRLAHKLRIVRELKDKTRG